ncbi:MAG: DUF4260 domain-containing protein [Bacteroidota bacterium]
MKKLIQLEELLLLILGFFLFLKLELSWWWYFALLLAPDIGMLGYVVGNKVGAWTYNLFHHRGIAVICYVMGTFLWENQWLALTGIILFSHTAMDRMLGYGLKYESSFHQTHLGTVGKGKN